MPAHSPAASVWHDTPQRFGRISRWLHWSMAALFAWQFLGMALKLALGRESPWAGFMGGTHAHVGLLLMVLILVRVGWSLRQWGRRPSNGNGLLGLAARLGHGALYALMLIVPFLATLRMLGNDRSFRWFGLVTLNDGQGPKVPWMIEPAAAAHGLLAWTLLALALGHIAMVLVHRHLWKDDVAQRMIGRVPPAQ